MQYALLHHHLHMKNAPARRQRVRQRESTRDCETEGESTRDCETERERESSTGTADEQQRGEDGHSLERLEERAQQAQAATTVAFVTAFLTVAPVFFTGHWRSAG